MLSKGSIIASPALSLIARTVPAHRCRNPRVTGGEFRMKQNLILTITSLLSILLLTLHITDDIVRGISKAEPSNIALAVLAVLLYGTLVLAGRRSGYVIMLLVGLLAAAMPVMHMRGHITARSPSPQAASSSSGHSGRSAGSGASPLSSRRADYGACDGASPGSPTCWNLQVISSNSRAPRFAPEQDRDSQ